MDSVKHSIVIPVYKNYESIPDLMACCRDFHTKLNGQIEFVFVVDGSPDQSFALLESTLKKENLKSRLVLLSRDFGAFNAIKKGLELARGEYIGVMAADLQEPPSFLLTAFENLSFKDCDIVVGERDQRNDGFFSDMASHIFWSLYRKIMPEIPGGGVDIFACTSQVRDVLLSLSENNSSLIGQLYWVGFRKKNIKYNRQKREKGTSAWTFKKKVTYLLDSLYGFTGVPLKFLLSLGLFGCGFSFILALVLIYFKLSNTIQVPGYVAIMLTIMFFGSLNLAGLGIVGEYLHRTFDNSKQRPATITLKVIDCN